MKLISFYSTLQKMDFPCFKTSDAAILCEISNSHASQLLTRLTKTKHVISLKKGLWLLAEKAERLTLPYFLTMPFPCYISLQTALYYRGMIMQIPDIIYVVSIARSKTYQTDIATISIHHITPEMYFGYDEIAPYTMMATPEKALIDFLYFGQTKSRLFSQLPELEIPITFDKKLAQQYIEKIPYKNRRQRVLKLYDQLIL